MAIVLLEKCMRVSFTYDEAALMRAAIDSALAWNDVNLTAAEYEILRQLDRLLSDALDANK